MDQSSRRRAGVLSVLFCGLFFALIVRLYAIQVAGHDDYLVKRDAQSSGQETLDAPPGPIYDATDQALAVSVPVESAWANPSAIADRAAAARLLAGALGLKESAVLEKLSREQLKFTWLKRRLTAQEADAVRRLASGPPFRSERKSPDRRLGLITEYQRQYPHGTLAAHVVGHGSVDPGHEEGVERTLLQLLSAPPKSVTVVKDGRRQVLGTGSIDLTTVQARLTLNLLLQKVVEEELEAACAEFQPKWAVAVVLDPRTGAILALANRPTYDPNQPGAAAPGARLNRALSAPIEPGSTLKPFTAVYALDLGLARPETKIDCELGLWKHGPRLLHDHHPYGLITLGEVIKFSSNIGAAKIGALMLGRNRLYECMRRWGFGERTGVDLSAEDPGLLFPLARWSLYSDTSVPMGHEIAVTPLQLVSAMAAIANGGTLYRPYLVRRVETSDGTVLVDNAPQVVRRVVGQKAAREMIEILEGVVTEGTGKKAQVDGVRVAGKTGTSQKIDPRTRQYTHEKYISSFVGFAPANDAKLCIAVILDEPQGAYYGGTVAAPAVGKIIQRGLVYVK